LAMARGFSRPRARSRTALYALQLRAAPRALARAEHAALRRGDLPQRVGIPRPPHPRGGAAPRPAVLRLRAPRARSLVSAHLPPEAREEVALLAVELLPGAARRAGRAVHGGGGGATRARVLLALPRAPGDRAARHRAAAGRVRCATRRVRAGVPRARGAAIHPLSRTHPRE